MKRIMLVLLLSTAVYAVNAQVRFGLKAGYNAARSYSNDPEIKEDGKIFSGLNLGAVVDIAVSKHFSIQPQAVYNRKGVGVAHDGHTDNYYFNVIDIPVNALYRSNGFFIGGGPNLGINLSGGLKAHDDPSENFKFNFGSDAGEIKRLDFGMNFTTGYELKNGLVFSANYLAGLTNLQNSAGNTWRNNLFGISVGYMFKTKAKK